MDNFLVEATLLLSLLFSAGAKFLKLKTNSNEPLSIANFSFEGSGHFKNDKDNKHNYKNHKDNKDDDNDEDIYTKLKRSDENSMKPKPCPKQWLNPRDEFADAKGNISIH